MSSTSTAPVHSTYDSPAQHAPSGVPWIWYAIVWVLIFCTFSLPDRLNYAVALDAVAQAKMATRVFAFAVLGALLLWQLRTRHGMAVARCLLPLALFALWGIVSVTWSPLRNVSVGQIGSFLVLFLLAAYVAVCWRSSRDTSSVLFHLNAALLIFSTVALLARVFYSSLGSGARVQDALVHATMAGATSSLGILLLLAARVVWNWKWSRYLVLPGLAIHGVLLVLAHNRTAIVATLIAGGLLYFLFVSRRAKWAGVLIFCLAAVSALVLNLAVDFEDALFSSGSQFVQRDEHDSLSNLSGRREMWEAMWLSYIESPWIGHGYFVSSAEGEMEVWFEMGNWTAHNAILQVLVSTGVVGALLMMWGLWRPARRMFSTLSRDRENDRLVRFLCVVAVWFFLWSLFNESITGPLQPECVVFFAMLGLGIGSAESIAAATVQSAAMPLPGRSAPAVT